METFSVWHWLIFVLPVILILVLKFGFNVGAKRVMLKNPQTGQIKKGFYGFSWTYLFFGWWVPLLRGELGIAALHLLFSIVTAGIWQVIVCFMYNSQYTNRRITEGYRIADTAGVNAAAAQALGIDLAIQAAR